jgi:hypothetical protein
MKNRAILTAILLLASNPSFAQTGVSVATAPAPKPALAPAPPPERIVRDNVVISTRDPR